VSAIPSIGIEAVGETVEGGDWHFLWVLSLVSQLTSDDVAAALLQRNAAATPNLAHLCARPYHFVVAV
jgi:hypothetical protein